MLIFLKKNSKMQAICITYKTCSCVTTAINKKPKTELQLHYFQLMSNAAIRVLWRKSLKPAGKGKSAEWTGPCVLGRLHLGQEAGSWEANLRVRLPPAGRHLQTSASAAQRPATRCRTGRLCSPGTKCTSRRPPS